MLDLSHPVGQNSRTAKRSFLQKIQSPTNPRWVGNRKPPSAITGSSWKHSQRGLLASAVFTMMPTNRMTRIEAQLFHILVLLPLPLSSRTCRCGRQLDQFGHHRAACSKAGVLGKRGFPLECCSPSVPRGWCQGDSQRLRA